MILSLGVKISEKSLKRTGHAFEKSEFVKQVDESTNWWQTFNTRTGSFEFYQPSGKAKQQFVHAKIVITFRKERYFSMSVPMFFTCVHPVSITQIKFWGAFKTSQDLRVHSDLTLFFSWVLSLFWFLCKGSGSDKGRNNNNSLGRHLVTSSIRCEAWRWEVSNRKASQGRAERLTDYLVRPTHYRCSDCQHVVFNKETSKQWLHSVAEEEVRCLKYT